MKPTKARRKINSKSTHRCGVCRKMREAIHRRVFRKARLGEVDA